MARSSFHNTPAGPKRYYLTTQQKNIWDLQKYYEGTAISNICGTIIYQDNRSIDWLQQSIRHVIENQTALRLRFSDTDPVSQYLSEEEISIEIQNFSDEPEMDNFVEKIAREPMRVIDSPMCAFTIFRLGTRTGIVAKMNHLIGDAWSFGLIADQINTYYEFLRVVGGDRDKASNNGKGDQCGDYLCYVQDDLEYRSSERFERDRLFWKEKYRTKPENSVIKLKESSRTQVINAKRIHKKLPVELSGEIAGFCNRSRITEAVVFESAVLLYLSRINPENNTSTIGVPVLNRNKIKEKQTAGMYISTMPLRIDLGGVRTVRELLEKVLVTKREMFRHQRFPYEEILRFVRNDHGFTGNLFDVMVSVQNSQIHGEYGFQTKWYPNGYCEVPYVITVDQRDSRETYFLTADFQTAVFPAEAEAEAVLGRIQNIVEQIVAGAENGLLVSDIDILPEEEKDLLLNKFNDTHEDYPAEKSVHELFEEQVHRTPNRVALTFEGYEFTYRQIDEMSNSLAQHLRGMGVSRNEVIPIIAKRDWRIIVAMLAVLKAGAGYMPVSPDYPVERIRTMLEIAESRIALCYGYDEELHVEKIDLAGFDFDKTTEPIESINCSDDLCYIIFTSGSTGTPKGIEISHKNVVNYTHSNNKNVVHNIITDENKTIVSVTNIVFDIFVTESLLPLINGFAICFANEEETESQTKIASLVEKNTVEVVQTTPTKLRSYLLDKKNIFYLSCLKAIAMGGEAFPPELYTELQNVTQARIYNVYGPAETTVWSTIKEIRNSEDITIGNPIANTQIYILDDHQRLLPIGVAGELCIAGAGVGRGYLNRPDLTAERFISNPFATEENGHGKVLYRTGDLARWRMDGEIEYLGRIDTQVKIRGLRIELSEIESVMAQTDGIGLVAVAAQNDETGRQYLVGYYTAATEINEKVMRKRLAEKLPKYMVPNYFMRLESMPMTASGKTDRKNLPKLEKNDIEREFIAPETETEIRLAELWSKQLHTENVGRTDDFFEMGGDSLSAISLAAEISQEFNIDISVRDFFSTPKLSDMALVIDNAAKAVRLMVAGKDTYRLLPQQKAIYAACRKNPESLLYNAPARIPLVEGIDRDRLVNTVTGVVQSHKELNVFVTEDASELYATYDPKSRIAVQHIDDEKEFMQPFDLSKAPLVHVGLTKDALLFDIHHIVCDGASLSILINEIQEAYKNKGIESQSTQRCWYGDYALYSAEKDYTGQIETIKKQLTCDYEPIVLPEEDTRKEGGRSKFYIVSKELTASARDFAKKNGLTDTILLLGTFGIVLSKYSGKTDVLTSVILQNRMLMDTREMVGMFVNTLPVYIKADGKSGDYFRHIKSAVTGVYQAQDVPFLTVADALSIDHSTVNTSFVYQPDGRRKLVLDGITLTPEFIETNTSKFDLTMELTGSEDGLIMRLEYNCTKYTEKLMDRLAYSFIRVLEQLKDNNISISEIDILPAKEKDLLLNKFNDTRVEYPVEKCVHELFQEQVQRTQDRTALTFEGQNFTYKQLDEMSNSLAWYLRIIGMSRNEVVPIIAKRDWRIIVAMLAVLKAGGAYMPVSPDYPVERIRTMLEIAGSRRALCYCYDDELPIEKIDLASFDFDEAKRPIRSINIPDDFCYIIFTSGSTGKPKGVSITHSNVCNYAHNNNNNNVVHRIVREDYRTIVSVTNIVFDIFVTESLLPLLNGLTICFANDEETVSQKKLASLIEKNKVDVIQTTPTKMRSYLMDKRNLSYLKELNAIVMGGEAFPHDLYTELRNVTDAEIFNIYGPAETTVWSSNAEVYSADMITIGRPIANTQIYILDSHQKLLPIGVAGELCIAGAGVGKGYLNRPDLTAERFIPNPYATEDNGHGKVLYRTGDLARWREDGEIEYLGRIDTQVKIRGLRIELGEIEAVMADTEGIGLVAVAAQKDGTGRQYLVGYYTSSIKIDEKALRKRLSEKLPKYMVPNYFMRLESMPMTASGKTDRKNLPVPDVNLSEREYVPPVTETEKILCGIMADVLSVSRYGVTDDFFELGGDSLGAISAVAIAHEKGIELGLQTLFDYPNVRELCARLEEAMKAGQTASTKAYTLSPEDYEKYSGLLQKNMIDDSAQFEKKETGNVFLTGATGFLGAHVLDALMIQTDSKVYCLVRAGEGKDPEKRLADILQWYFGTAYSEEIGIRIIPVEGDIERDDLSDTLPEDVQTVIHTAATVKHYGAYDYFKKINVEGTRHTADYARRIGAEFVHISTISVSGNAMADGNAVYRSEKELFFGETDYYIGQPLDNVYIRSKFEAEQVVMDGMLEQGLNAKIIRIGNLTNRAGDFRFQPNYDSNAFLMRLKAILELGLFPDYLLPLYSEFSPVDLTAEGIVKIIQYAKEQTVFHLYSNKPLTHERMLPMLRSNGISLKTVTGEEFYNEVERSLQSKEREFIFKSLRNDMDTEGRLIYDSNIRIKNEFTVWFMSKIGFEWNEIDEDYVKGYLDYFRKAGFLNV